MRSVQLEVCSICHKKILPNEPAFVFDKNVVCLKCDESLRKPKPVPDPPLPGTTIATLWDAIGLVSLGSGIAVGIITIALAEKSRIREAVIYLLICVGIGVAWSIIPFSVAAIIKAINANTEELRKVRYAMAKFFSEKLKNE